jgi:transposase-like protein
MYLFQAVDSYGQTVDSYLSETRDREAAQIFLKKALANPDNRPLHVLAETACGATRRQFESYRPRDT